MFCERFQDALVAQPANTWSNLGFVAVGLLVGAQAARDLAGGSAPRNRMTTTRFYPALYAGVAAFLGPGSAAMHASTTRWGGRVDVFSMYLWILWVIAFQITRLRNGNERDFLRIWLPMVAVIGVPHFAGWIPFSSDVLFGLLVTAGVVFETLLVRNPETPSGRTSFLFWAVGAFLLAFAIWIPSRTEGPLCDPDSLVQGHAIWHLLCAGSVWFLYRYARSIQPT